MRHVSGTHRVALDWLFDRINLDTKIQIKYIDTKNQLADILTKGNFTRDEWNHLLCLLNISHFSSGVCSDTMAKRSQGRRRSYRLQLGKKHYGSQDPWKSVAGEDRSGRPGKETDLFEASDHYCHEQFMESFSSTDYSKLDYDRAWSSQEWKAEATTYDRSGRPDKTSWRMVRQVRPDHAEILLDGTAQSVLPCSENLRNSSWSYDMEGHAKKCVWNDIVSWQTRRLNRYSTVSSPCLDDHQFKEEELKSVGELSKVRSQIVVKCSYLARIGRPDILWSVNKLARSIAKWTKVCDKRSSRLMYYIHHTCEYKQYVLWVILPNNADLDCFKTPILQEILRIQKSTSGGTLCVFGSHTFVPIIWMCKKQTSVSHSSIESEIISLYAGLRMDGIPALDL